MTHSDREKIVLSCIDSKGPHDLDDIIEESGLQPHEVLAMLIVLEVRRLIRQLPGKRFERINVGVGLE